MVCSSVCVHLLLLQARVFQNLSSTNFNLNYADKTHNYGEYSKDVDEANFVLSLDQGKNTEFRFFGNLLVLVRFRITKCQLNFATKSSPFR